MREPAVVLLVEVPPVPRRAGAAYLDERMVLRELRDGEDVLVEFRAFSADDLRHLRDEYGLPLDDARIARLGELLRDGTRQGERVLEVRFVEVRS